MHLDCTKLGLFLMCFNTAYKLVLCLMRRLVTKNDRINAPVAGFLSALSLALDADSRRELFMALTMSRAIESTLKIGEEKGAIPKLKHRDFILWLLTNCFIGATMGLKQGIMN